METLHPIAGFRSEPNLSRHGRLATPPYTPAKPKRRLERSDSPASSIHPAETSSPARKLAKRAATDTITVEELVEGDIGYLTDIDVVYPEELEEVEDALDWDSEADADAESESGISTNLAKLRCDDEAEMQKRRRERRLSRRTGSRVFKRSHSQSIKGDTDATDSDGINDQDVEVGARRLRRRVRGPGEDAEQGLDDRPPGLDEGDAVAYTGCDPDQADDVAADEVMADAMDVE